MKIEILHTYNGGELCNREFKNYLTTQGIVHQKTIAYTAEQYGVCERANRTTIEKARCMIFDTKIEKQFRAKAASTSVYLKTCVTLRVKGKTPYEV